LQHFESSRRTDQTHLLADVSDSTAQNTRLAAALARRVVVLPPHDDAPRKRGG
jgi:hypothetical protein